MFFVKRMTAYELRISDWSSDVCSSDLLDASWDGRRPAGGCDARGRSCRDTFAVLAQEFRLEMHLDTGALGRSGENFQLAAQAARPFVHDVQAVVFALVHFATEAPAIDRKSTRLNSSH